MKLLALLVTATLSMSAHAQTTHTCVDNDNADFTLTYSNGSQSSEATIQINNAERELVPGNLREQSFWMRDFESPLGTMVTAFTYPHHIADAPTSVYSVLIPLIPTIPPNGVTYETVLLLGYSGGFRPSNVPQSNIRKTINLRCEVTQ